MNIWNKSIILIIGGAKMKWVWMFWVICMLAGCEECIPGEEKCSSGVYHMACEESDINTGNWIMVENCMDS